jgi:hypothetical protein
MLYIFCIFLGQFNLATGYFFKHGNYIVVISLVLFGNIIGFGFMVFNATFKNISAISWWSVLLVEETGVPVENH